MIRKYLLTIIILSAFALGSACAVEQIPISRSYEMDKVIFDGKWTFLTEWKKSSLYELTYDDGTHIELRTAHQGDFIYVFIDAITQTHFAKGSDKAVVCIDGKNDRSVFANDDDYCVGVALGDNSPFVLRGGSPLEITNHFTKIEIPEGVIGIAAVSDENDHYTPIPHPGYEYKIPINLFGRADVYGFYVGVYDSGEKKTYSFPENLTENTTFKIPGPNTWGQIVSPDESLPEFPLPVVVFSGALVAVMFITRKAYSFMNH